MRIWGKDRVRWSPRVLSKKSRAQSAMELRPTYCDVPHLECMLRYLAIQTICGDSCDLFLPCEKVDFYKQKEYCIMNYFVDFEVPSTVLCWLPKLFGK